MHGKREIDVLLFNPKAVRGWHAYHRRALPLSLLHLAGPLERKGYRVGIIDQFSDPHWQKKLDEALSGRPILFGVTSMSGPQIRYAVDACRHVRMRRPDVPIVWGGIHATILPEQTLESPYVDAVVVGEGETALVELVRAFETGGSLGEIRGLAYRQNGSYRFTGTRPFLDLNEMPIPAYHLVDMANYDERILGMKHIHLITSRGCVHRCAFCWDPLVNKRRFRAMHPALVLDLMEHIIKRYGIKGFIFGDDDFFINPDRAHDILTGVVKREFGVSIGKLFIRADTLCKLDRDFMDLMVRAGVRRLVIGAESGSQRVLELIRKDITTQQIIEGNRKLLPYPIRPGYLFMMGFPTETIEEVGQSLHLADQLLRENPRATRSFNIYTPFPGTELFRLTVQMGLEVPGQLQDWTKFTYRYLPEKTPWLLPETRRIISILDYALMSSVRDNSLGPVKKADPLSVWLARVYGPLANYRVKHLDARLPIELKLINLFKRLLGRDRD